MNTVKEPPERVTRFYGSAEYALDVIANKQITFVHVSTLNDPFDPYFFLETNFEESRNKLLKYVETHYPRDLGWFKQCVTPQSWTQTIRELKKKLESYREQTFIFSTSSENNYAHPKDSLYMWGHYGNGHRGVAIEFNTISLTKSALKHHEAVRGKPLGTDQLWHEIIYSKSFSPITTADYYEFMKQEYEFHTGIITQRVQTNLEKYYERMLRVKSDVWKPEREWRLMWSNDETRMKIHRCPIDGDAITTVYLGYSISVAHKTDFVFETKRKFPQAKILGAKKRHGDFALDFEQL
jgi:hypothetical protein